MSGRAGRNRTGDLLVPNGTSSGTASSTSKLTYGQGNPSSLQTIGFYAFFATPRSALHAVAGSGGSQGQSGSRSGSLVRSSSQRIGMWSKPMDARGIAGRAPLAAVAAQVRTLSGKAVR